MALVQRARQHLNNGTIWLYNFDGVHHEQTRPVLIVGAGPTGLTAAMELSRFNAPVRIMDQYTTAPQT